MNNQADSTCLHPEVKELKHLYVGSEFFTGSDLHIKPDPADPDHSEPRGGGGSTCADLNAVGPN